MAAQLVLPKDCSNNKMCEITKMILGPTAKFYITGAFEWKKVRVAVGFAHIRIWDGLYFDKLELYVEVSPEVNRHPWRISEVTGYDENIVVETLLCV